MKPTITYRHIHHRAHTRRLDICRSLCVWGMRITDVAENWGIAPSTVKSIHGENCVLKGSLVPMSDFQYSTPKGRAREEERKELGRLSHSV